MAERTIERPCEIEILSRRLRARLFIGALILCFGLTGQSASAQAKPRERRQWKQSIERPSRVWDYDGKRILGHIGHDICLWDAETGKLLHRMKGHKERIHAVQFSPDGHHALSSSFMPPGPMLPLISRDTRVILWNLDAGRERDSFQRQVAGEFSPDGRKIVTFTQRPGTGVPDPAWAGGKNRVWELGTAPEFDAAVWETFTGRQLVKAKLPDHGNPKQNTLHFSSDGRSFVYVVEGAYLLRNSSGATLFNTSDGREIGTVTRGELKGGKGHRYISSGALASFGPERAKLIDITSGRVIQSVELGRGPKDDSLALGGESWTHDGSKVVAIPPHGEQIRILHMESGKVTTGARTGSLVGSAIISPDNSRLAVEWGGANDVEPGMGLYDTNTGEEVARIKLAKWGHMLGFSPDSKTMLVGGSEFVIYKSKNGKKVRTLKLLDDDSFRYDWDK